MLTGMVDEHMEPSDSASLLEKLNNGEKVRCTTCEKGYMLKGNPKAKKNLSFYCSKCGARWIFEKPVIVE